MNVINKKRATDARSADESELRRDGRKCKEELIDDGDDDMVVMKAVLERCRQHCLDDSAREACPKSPPRTSKNETEKTLNDGESLTIVKQTVASPSIQSLDTDSSSHECCILPGAHAVAGSTNQDSFSWNENGAQAEQNDFVSRQRDSDTTIEGAIVVEDELVNAEEGMQEEVVIEGTILQENNKAVSNHQSSVQRRFLPLFFVGLLLAGALAILLVLLLPSSKNDSNTKTRSEANDSPVVYPPYASDLSFDIQKSIQDVTDSYYFANAWMLQDPYLATYSLTRQKQRFLLSYFYYQFGGPNWHRNDHWLSYNVSECLWFSHNSSLDIGGWNVGMDPEPQCDEDGYLTVMNLTSNNLQGASSVQSEGFGPHLKILDVSDNSIEGPIPSMGSNAANMEVFIVSNNKFEGFIMGGGGFSSFNLRIVKVDGNELGGYYPIVCSVLPSLEVLNLTGGLYTTAITPDMKYCKNLTILSAANNLYEGGIPSELGLLPKLKEVDIAGNSMMTGTIPTELASLPKLELLDVTGTGLQGAVPDEMCTRTNNDETKLQIFANCSKVHCCE